MWQKVLHDDPTLRGSDYEEKEVFEQEKQLELGYTIGYHQDVKRLRKIYEEKTE